MTIKKQLLFIALTVNFVFIAKSQERPPKFDVPFLVHADNLIETESNVAVEQQIKKELFYQVQNPSSGVSTPMARPEFVVLTNDMDPHGLRLYAFELNNGNREIMFRKKKKIVARSYFLSVENLGEGTFRIRTDDVLENGEYCLTPDGSNKVFCFTVY